MKFSFFSFNWLGSEDRKQKKAELELKQRELDIKEKELLQLGTKEQLDQDTVEATRAYRSVRLIGKTCLLVLNDGTTLSKEDPELLGKVRQAQSEEEIIELFTKYEAPTDREEEKEERALVVSNIGILKDHEDFEVKGDTVFLKGVNLAIPPVVLASMIELIEKMDNVWEEEKDGCISCEIDELEEKFEALKMFWLKLCLNGREQSRKDLLAFCRENDVRITKNGNLILYRNLVSLKQTDKKYTEFISQQYFKVKGHKKSPKNYWVWHEDDGSYKLVNEDFTSDGIGSNLGSLYNLYQGLSSHVGNKYTSKHNKGKYEINIGSIYRIDEKDINLDNSVCHSGGLVCSPAA